MRRSLALCVALASLYAAAGVRQTQLWVEDASFGDAPVPRGIGACAEAGAVAVGARRHTLEGKGCPPKHGPRGLRRLRARLGLTAVLRGLVLDFLPVRYVITLETGLLQAPRNMFEMLLFEEFGLSPNDRFPQQFQRWEIALTLRGDLSGHLKPGFSRARFLGKSTNEDERVHRTPRWATPTLAASPDGKWVVGGLGRRLLGAMWSPRSSDVRWTSGMFDLVAATFSPGGDMVAFANKDEVVVFNSSNGEALCRARTRRRPKRLAFMGSRLEVCGEDGGDVPVDPALEGSTRLTSFRLRHLPRRCMMFRDVNDGDICEDVAISRGEALLLRDSGDTVSIGRTVNDGGGTLFATRLNASRFINGRFSPDGRSVYMNTQSAAVRSCDQPDMPATGCTKMLWPFASGREPQRLPDVYRPGDWTFSDDGEVLIALDVRGPRVIDLASGSEIDVRIDEDSLRWWPNMTGEAFALLTKVSGHRLWAGDAQQ